MILSLVAKNVTVKMITLEKSRKHVLNRMYSIAPLKSRFKYQEVSSLKSFMTITNLKSGTHMQHADPNWK